MTWWLTDVARARSEQAGLAELCERFDWITELSWRLKDDFQLVADFCITHGKETFNLYMAYPSTFPDTPPMVIPHEEKRISCHQYGPGGELCLEFRPDNWTPTLTGAMMAESAYRLLSGERPAHSESSVVRSAHQASIGRATRAERMRFLIDLEAVEILSGLPIDTAVPIKAWDRIEKPTWVASLTGIGADNSIWSLNCPIPSRALNAEGIVIRTTQEISRFWSTPQASYDRIPVELPDIATQVPTSPFCGFVLLGDGDQWAVLNLCVIEGKQVVFGYKTVITPRASNRLPGSHLKLASKRVGIIGCGSVGSKIAASLARSGIQKFTLVDDDLFFQGNLVRNELDASALGLHKVDALTTRINEIVPLTEISCRRVSLGQQESAGTTESVMKELMECDLLVDATADPRAFNLIASVARRRRIPMVWCEVFAGGIGGIIARSRPGQDPIPTAARGQIQGWCDSHGVPWEAVTHESYGMQLAQETPLIADDGDVSVIAAHASRMVIDALSGEKSMFPESAYAIGLNVGWIFQAPFDTWPIQLQPEGEWGEDNDVPSQNDFAEFFATLMPGGKT